MKVLHSRLSILLDTYTAKFCLIIPQPAFTCSKLTIKIPIFNANFEHISYLVLMFLLLTLNMWLPAGMTLSWSWVSSFSALAHHCLIFSMNFSFNKHIKVTESTFGPKINISKLCSDILTKYFWTCTTYMCVKVSALKF